MDVDGMKVNDNMVNKLSLQEHELWKIVPSESDSSLADCDCEILCYVGARFSDCQHTTLALIGEQQSLTPTTCIEERNNFSEPSGHKPHSRPLTSLFMFMLRS